MPTDTITLSAEARAAIDALNNLPTDQHADVIKALQNDGGPIVKTFRTKVFGNGKKEGANVGEAVTQQLTAKDEEIERLTAQVEEWKGKAPEAQAIEQRLSKEWQKKLEAATKRAEAAEGTLTQTRTRTFRSQFGKALRDLDVDPDYADEVLAARFGDRYRVGPDGTTQVLKPGEDSAFDAGSEEEAIKLLAAEVKKAVPAKFILSNADSGAGVTNGGGGGAGGDIYSRIRAEAKKENDARQAAGGKTGAELMGLRPANT